MAQTQAMGMTVPSRKDGWQDSAHQLWQQGQRQEAIDQLLTLINASAPAVPKPLGLQLVYYVFLLGDLAGAENFLRNLLAIHPEDPEIIENLAVMISRQGERASEAASLFEQACELRPDSVNAWDGLASARSTSGDDQRARQAGERSLALKTVAAKPLSGWAPPAGGVQAFLQRPGQASRIHCISFSIWGTNPRYRRGALRNALLIPELSPGWRARFHLDDSVPEAFIVLLQSLGAEVQRMPAGGSLRQKLCWRFLVANDPGVGRFLVRDCDSVVSQREVRAVEQWLDSDRWFHVMRDWWSHTDPILAGLWGGISGVLPDLQGLLAAYTPTALETANVDQWFLRDGLWGSIRPHALIHDRCYRSEGSQPWPDADPSGNLHVGQDEFALRRSQQAAWLHPWIRSYRCLQLPNEPQESEASLPPELLQQLVIKVWPGPLPEGPVSMPAGVSGRIINLDTAVERWSQMQAQLDSLGWTQSHRRQPAQRAEADEARQLGLRNGGELGLWRTTTSLLEQWLGEQPAAGDVLHVLEDDAIINPALPLLIKLLRQQNPPLDILFSEAFLTTDLYRRFRALEDKRQREGNAVLLLNGGQYLACTSSYILSRDGAKRLLLALREQEATARLVPIDMVIRQSIREGKLKASISLPFFSTIRAGLASSIQQERPTAVQLSQDVDLSLRRLLYLQAWQPAACGGELGRVSEVLADGLAPAQIETLVVEMLMAGRREGWLPGY
jgi:GR25 family glycosyltransferase involved in LPS biosynthesis